MVKLTKILFLGLLLSALLVLSACNQQQPQNAAQRAFIGGTQGVLPKFELFGVEENGVDSIFDTETFPVEVTLQNKGEYEIQPGDITVKLLGPSQSEFSGIPSFELRNLNILEKISELTPNGGEETISFATDARYLSEVRGVIDRTWFANVEYNYQTYIIIPEVCLKENPTDTRVCDVKGAKQFFVSGAPIIITAVEEDTAGRGIMALRIMVSNVGGGDKVTIPGQDFGVNDRIAFSIDDQDWECKSGGRVNEARLVNNGAEIVCKLKNALATDTIATKQLKLTLDYKYRDIIQETLRIKESVQ